jgi:hypothetical protein
MSNTIQSSTQPISRTTAGHKYSFPHNDEQQPDHQELPLGLDAAPPLARVVLQWQAARNPLTKVVYVLNSVICFVPFNYIVLGTGVLNSTTIGVVLAVYGPTSMFVWLTQPVISTPGSVFHSAIFSNKSSLHKFNKTLTQQIIGMAVVCCVFFTVAYTAIVIPMLGTQHIFGEHNDTLLYIFMVTNTVTQVLNMAMQIAGDAAIVMFAQVRMNTTRTYIGGIKQTLLDTELGEKEQLVKLTEAHCTVETFAREANKGLGTTDSAKIFIFCSWIVIFLISATLISTSTSTKSKSRTIVLLCVFIVLVTVLAFQAMVNITAPIRAWNSACDQELNTPSIQRTINALFGRRKDFDRWLSSHEMATQRLFGLKVSMERIRQVGGLGSSLIALAVYLIARQELMQML